MQPNDHIASFLMSVRHARRLLSRQVRYFHDGTLPKTELELIYELAFLRMFTSFENQLVELLKTNLMMTTDANGRVRSNFPVSSRSQAGKLLLGASRYFQLLPVEQMERIARVYLKNGGPFVLLSSAQKGALTKAYAIRNHIAHRSPDSRASYAAKVLNSVSLPRTSYSPGYYLRNQMTSTVTYFDHHVSELGASLNFLCASS